MIRDFISPKKRSAFNLHRELSPLENNPFDRGVSNSDILQASTPLFFGTFRDIAPRDRPCMPLQDASFEASTLIYEIISMDVAIRRQDMVKGIPRIIVNSDAQHSHTTMKIARLLVQLDGALSVLLMLTDNAEVPADELVEQLALDKNFLEVITELRRFDLVMVKDQMVQISATGKKVVDCLRTTIKRDVVHGNKQSLH